MTDDPIEPAFEDEPDVPKRRSLESVLTIALVLLGLSFLSSLSLVGVVWYNNDQANDRQDKALKVVEGALGEVNLALDQFEADRIDRSVNACQDRNSIRIGVNLLALQAGGHDENGQPTPDFLAATPERQARALEFLSRLLPLQICTTEAINRFVESNRTEGLVPINGTDGYAEAVVPP